MRRGFTILEMLVATALVMLMMLLFAEIFGAAIGVITAQRGIANNDQKARSLTAILKHDLESRTYGPTRTAGATKELVSGLLEAPRGIVALAEGDIVDSRQAGILYISENNVDDDTDDVLHLTVFLPPGTGEEVSPRFYGRAVPVGAATDSNQPDRDDGVAGDGAASSRAAEVVYFMRGGNLYRRVLLLREPATGALPFSTQPTIGLTGTGGPLMPTYPPAPTTTFYRDFDFSATNVSDQLHFHGLEALDNASGLSNAPLGVPPNRFGYDPNGVPLEVDVAGRWIGRFTQEETSAAAFQWPGINNVAGNNVVDSQLVLSPGGIVAVDVNTNGSYDAGTDTLLIGSRVGEDILLTNVESFDIEVWDPAYIEDDFDGSGSWNAPDDLNGNGIQDRGAWVDLGNRLGLGSSLGEGIGLFCETSNSAYGGNATWGRQNAAYGPNGPSGNHVFDTWHPSLGGSAPYRPLQRAVPDRQAWTQNQAGLVVGETFSPDLLGFDGEPGRAGFDDDGNSTIDDASEIGFDGSDDNVSFSLGFVVIASV